MKTIDEIYKLAKGLSGLDVYGLELEIEDIREIGDNVGEFSWVFLCPHFALA